MQYLLAPDRPGNRKPGNTQKTSGGVFLTPGRAIYGSDGRIGHLAVRGSEIDAFDRQGNPVGSFFDVGAAVDALVARVRP
jgi:hypothetical protein